MWWCNRRAFLTGAAATGLTACGFTPVYGPQGGGTALQGTIALTESRTVSTYYFNRRFEERMGRGGPAAPYRLDVQLQSDSQDLGSTSAGDVTRIRLIGRAFYTLKDASGATLLEGRTNAFSGYSNTGTTVATRAAQKDAKKRLMVLLADQVIDDLLLADVTGA
ncbi:LPS assembly lipoprotein LptE [Antarctobacter jejuensis]|uniref:LPS assembly lipoprotein LptE n=1 Tax=Antarctobacter jejuensis TaxID=1439938 RepID=UPI003FD4EC6B